jgi:hypothetical protein
MPLHRSIADIPEQELIRDILADPLRRSDMLRIDGIPNNCLICESVTHDDAPGNKQGDIDILVCHPDRPHEATGIQVKRIKITESAFHTGMPNKLQAFEEGVRQANTLAQLGFWQIYLYVFVVVDSRENNGAQVSYAGASPELQNVISQTVSTRDLDQRVGLIKYEFVQPMDYPPLSVGTGSTRLCRKATTGAQSNELTEWVRQLMISHPALFKNAAAEALSAQGRAVKS